MNTKQVGAEQMAKNGLSPLDVFILLKKLGTLPYFRGRPTLCGRKTLFI